MLLTGVVTARGAVQLRRSGSSGRLRPAEGAGTPGTGSPKHWPLGCSLTDEMKTYFEIGI